jgi:DNA-directed RNA polymerase specialized sigma24 family protein
MAAFMGGSDPDQDPKPWVDEHGDRLYRYALVRVRVPEVAEDLVQETLLAAVREKFGGRSSERSWLVPVTLCPAAQRLGNQIS